MAKMYLPVIAPKDYEAFRKILRDEIPSNYAEWRRDVDKWQAVHRAQQDTIIEVEVSPNSFADYLRQNDYAPAAAAFSRIDNSRRDRRHAHQCCSR